MIVSRTKDKDLIKEIVTNPILYSQVGHVKDPKEYEPYLGDIWLKVEENDKIIGLVKFKRFSAITFEGHIYILPEYQATGKSLEAASESIKYIKKFHAQNVIVPVPALCHYVIKFLTKLGFKVCGLIKDGIIHKGNLQDIIMFQLEI